MSSRNIIVLLFAGWVGFFSTLEANASTPGNTLSGIITEKTTGKSLPGVTVYIPDLKTGSITDKDGRYLIENLPRAKVQIQISFIGYNRIIEIIDLSQVNKKDFVLEKSVAELHEVVITGMSKTVERNRTPSPVVSIPAIQLQRVSSNNIIDAISEVPGISQVSTGAAISKPVIRGLGYNRVVVIHNGTRQEGQQWGDEHGVEIDELSVGSVEILKGPASLAYGSDALAGVINLMGPSPAGNGLIEGKALAGYQTNNGLIKYGALLAGNNKGFVWDFRLSSGKAHAYKNKTDGYVFNSGYFQQGAGGMFGLNRSWGYTHLQYSVFEMKPGIPEGERDEATGKFIKETRINDSTSVEVIADNDDFKSYKAFVPYQTILHYKLSSDNNFIIGNHSLKTNIAWQQNRRKEFGEILEPDHFGLFFLLNTVNYDVRMDYQLLKHFEFTSGVSGMYQHSLNKGSEYVVPGYNLTDAGIYTLFRRNSGIFDFSGGLRYDTRTHNGDALYVDSTGQQLNPYDNGAVLKFQGFSKRFQGLSGSVGVAFQLSKVFYTKLNFAAGFRAPNIAELASNGIHEGSGRYEIGNLSLKPERNLQWDFSFGVHSNHVTGEINIFLNSIDSYIFNTRLTSVSGQDSIIDDAPVYNFRSDHAELSGGEVSIDIHPHPYDWLHFENSFSMVNAVRVNQPDSLKYLPFIPAPRFASEIRTTFNGPLKGLSNSYWYVKYSYTFGQEKIYSVGETETITKAYSLFGTGIGTDVTRNGKTILSLYFNIDNLLDVAYQNHLSRLKYAPQNEVNGIRGIHEMGRSFNLKLVVPLKFRELQDVPGNHE